ncbi:hypothetical protein OROMI_007856 [Orobanche minor]
MMPAQVYGNKTLFYLSSHHRVSLKSTNHPPNSTSPWAANPQKTGMIFNKLIFRDDIFVDEPSDDSSESDTEEFRRKARKSSRKARKSSDSDEFSAIQSNFKHELANGDPFIEAIFDPDLAKLEALLKEKNTGDYYGTGDRDGELLHISDALYWGCHFGYAKAVKLMLEMGVVPLKYPPHICAEGPIVIGACYGGLEVLQTVTESVLVNHPNYVRSFLNARDRISNSSALHIAAKFRDTDMYPYQYAEDRSYIYDILRTEQMHCALRDK